MQPEILRADETAEYFFEEGCHILELSNSDQDPAVSIARARVAPGRSTRWHRLEGTIERYVILQGRGLVQVGGASASEVTVGDVVRILAGTPQRITNPGPEDLVFLAICTPRFRRENYHDEERTN